MSLKDLLPLIGVIVGWLLNEFSDSLKQRGQDRKEVGRALVGLLQLHDELQRLKTFEEFYKDRAGSWQNYKLFRARTAKRYMERTDPCPFGRRDTIGTIDARARKVRNRLKC